MNQHVPWQAESVPDAAELAAPPLVLLPYVFAEPDPACHSTRVEFPGHGAVPRVAGSLTIYLNNVVRRARVRIEARLRGDTTRTSNVGLTPAGIFYALVEARNATAACPVRGLAAVVRVPVMQAVSRANPDQIWFRPFPTWETASGFAVILRRVVSGAERAPKGAGPLRVSLPWPEADWVLPAWKAHWGVNNYWQEMSVRRAFCSLSPFGGAESAPRAECRVTGELLMNDFDVWKSGGWVVRDGASGAWRLQ